MQEDGPVLRTLRAEMTSIALIPGFEIDLVSTMYQGEQVSLACCYEELNQDLGYIAYAQRVCILSEIVPYLQVMRLCVRRISTIVERIKESRPIRLPEAFEVLTDIAPDGQVSVSLTYDQRGVEGVHSFVEAIHVLLKAQEQEHALTGAIVFAHLQEILKTGIRLI